MKFEITQEILESMNETELAFLYMAICANVEEDTSELLQYLIAERDGEKIYTLVEHEFWRLWLSMNFGGFIMDDLRLLTYQYQEFSLPPLKMRGKWYQIKQIKQTNKIGVILCRIHI